MGRVLQTCCHIFLVIHEEMDLDAVPVELMDITSTCEVEISDDIECETSVNSASALSSTEDQQMIKDEIKEEEMEDANASQEISQQGKRLLLKV